MGVKIREQRSRLYLDIYWQKHRHWESLGLTLGSDPRANKETWRLAEIIRQKRELQLVSGEHGLIDPIEGKRSLIEYAESLAEKTDSKNPLPKSLRYLGRYAGTIQIEAIKEQWVEGYRDFLLEQKGIGKSTASKYFSALAMILRRATRDRILPRNPAESVKGITAPESVKVYLTPSELMRLAEERLGGELGAEVKRAFLFAALTGFRISDIRSLSWGDVTRDPWQIMKRQAKTGRVVAVPLNEAAVRLIKEDVIHGREDLVFPRLTESKANTNQYLVAWARAAHVDKQLGWHTARRTFATLILSGGADIATVSRLLGHTKVATTMIYAKSTDEAKRAAVAALPDISLKQEKA